MPFLDRSEENTIVIGETRYSVHQLSEAQRTMYWLYVDGLAKIHINPWQDLYDKIKYLPSNLQEIVFANSRKRLFPLTRQELSGICCGVEAIEKLVELSLDVFKRVSSATAMDEKAIIRDRLYNLLTPTELLQVYIDLLRLLGDSYPLQQPAPEEERHLHGPEAIAHLRGIVAAEAAESSAASTDEKAAERAANEKAVADGE